MGFTSTERGVNGSGTLAPTVHVDVAAISDALRAIDSTNSQMLARFAAAFDAAASAVGILATHALNMGPAWLLNSDTSKFHQWIAFQDGGVYVPDLSQSESWPAYQITTGFNLYLRHETSMLFHAIGCELDGATVIPALEQVGVAIPTSPYHIINWLYDPIGGLWYRLWAVTDGAVVPELNQTGVSIIA